MVRIIGIVSISPLRCIGVKRPFGKQSCGGGWGMFINANGKMILDDCCTTFSFHCEQIQIYLDDHPSSYKSFGPLICKWCNLTYTYQHILLSKTWAFIPPVMQWTILTHGEMSCRRHLPLKHKVMELFHESGNGVLEDEFSLQKGPFSISMIVGRVATLREVTQFLETFAHRQTRICLWPRVPGRVHCCYPNPNGRNSWSIGPMSLGFPSDSSYWLNQMNSDK